MNQGVGTRQVKTQIQDPVDQILSPVSSLSLSLSPPPSLPLSLNIDIYS
jgi:hypothetical protein